jgi:predicted SprT family Zn-dependent metalloprotease
MNPITRDLAQAHISELRRQACSYQCRCVLHEQRTRRHRFALHRPSFNFLPFEAGLFRHP